jgi:hypothetical protein
MHEFLKLLLFNRLGWEREKRNFCREESPISFQSFLRAMILPSGFTGSSFLSFTT